METEVVSPESACSRACLVQPCRPIGFVILLEISSRESSLLQPGFTMTAVGLGPGSTTAGGVGRSTSPWGAPGRHCWSLRIPTPGPVVRARRLTIGSHPSPSEWNRRLLMLLTIPFESPVLAGTQAHLSHRRFESNRVMPASHHKTALEGT